MQSPQAANAIARAVLGAGFSRLAVALAPVFAAQLLVGCHGCENEAPSEPAASAPAGELSLTPEQEARVLATVGERKITLGDYVTALSRLDQFERLRYQTPERRQLLLDEMINVELLAREAERRGLDKLPETQAHVRQVLRQEVVRNLREQLPKLEELSAAEVRAYYDSHPEEFSDPARRRVAVIGVRSKAEGERVLEKARAVDAKGWGQLVREHSKLTQEQGAPIAPLELEGDLGLVSEAKSGPTDNPKVPEPVRQAVFGLTKQGDISDKLVEHEGWFYIVRLLGVNAPRKRTPAEVDNVIRARLLHQRLEKAEANLDAELRKQIPVTINEAGLQQLTAPVGSSK